MIVRILEEGQYELDDDTAARLDELDSELDHAIASGDETAYHRALDALVTAVRSKGKRLDDGQILPSDLALPPATATLDEVKSLLASEKDEG